MGEQGRGVSERVNRGGGVSERVNRGGGVSERVNRGGTPEAVEVSVCPEHIPEDDPLGLAIRGLQLQRLPGSKHLGRSTGH